MVPRVDNVLDIRKNINSQPDNSTSALLVTSLLTSRPHKPGTVPSRDFANGLHNDMPSDQSRQPIATEIVSKQIDVPQSSPAVDDRDVCKRTKP